ncbi:MAG: hypothetical protein IPK82_26150 [Polyangiaceae bacterium]|nr:hypothetical protein [Polyangiaceae bacterium]
MVPQPKQRSVRLAIFAGAISACAFVVPRFISGVPASAYFEGDLAAHKALAADVKNQVESGVAATAFHTGSARFDGEWAFGTFTMAALGLGNIVVSHPETREHYLAALDRAAEELVSPQTNTFGTEAWGNFGFDGLPGGKGHGYLGYSNLSLSMVRLVDPNSKRADLHDRLTEALAKRLEESPHALFETYPGEAYPADMAMVAGSIALHDCAVGRPERPFFKKWKEDFSKWIDPGSGLLYQSGFWESGKPAGPPRSSGTALAALALAYLDRDLSKQLFSGLQKAQTSVLGYSAIHEYAAGQTGTGDIDSGPVVFGVSVSATGFTMGSARLHGDRELFTGLYRTADLFGVPVHKPSGVRFMSGGPLGNAILLAMTTAGWDYQKFCKKAAP